MWIPSWLPFSGVTLSEARGLWHHGEILRCAQNYGFFAQLRMTYVKTVTLSEAKGLWHHGEGFFASLRMTVVKIVTLSEAKGLWQQDGDSSLRSE